MSHAATTTAATAKDVADVAKTTTSPGLEAAGESFTGHVFQGTTSVPSTGQARRYVHHGKGPLPPMPRVGLPEETYLHVAHKAERNGDDLVFEAAKVGQYITLATKRADDPWHVKLKYFRHALKRHCQAPEHADAMTKEWFGKLATLVRAHAGAEALRLAGEMDDVYDARRSMGQSPEQIADDAEKFFDQVCPMCETCPPIYNEDDWRQLKIFRDRWI